MINIKSSLAVSKTVDRLVEILNDKGMTVFNRIHHSDAAHQADIAQRDPELVIFGNPMAGSPLMKCQQSIALDLPQTALVREDAKANVWISCNAPA